MLSEYPIHAALPAIDLERAKRFYADMRRGRRPSFTNAAPPSLAEPLVERFKAAIAAYGLTVADGIFGAMMRVELCNDGPVTIWMDSEEL